MFRFPWAPHPRDPIRSSDREGAAAATGLRGVWIGEVETTTDQRGAEVQLHSVDVQQALGVADHAELVPFRSFVVVGLVVIQGFGGRNEVHGVTHAAAASRPHADAQNLIVSLFAAELRQLLHGRCRDQDPFAVASGVGGWIRGGAGHRLHAVEPHSMESDK